MGFAWLPDSGLTRVSIGSLRKAVTNQAGDATNRPTFPKAWATNEFVESGGCVSAFCVTHPTFHCPKQRRASLAAEPPKSAPTFVLLMLNRADAVGACKNVTFRV